MSTQGRRGGLRKTLMVLASVAAIAVLSLALPFTGLLLTGPSDAVAQTRAAAPEGFTDGNPRANFWREVRRGNEGYSAIKGNERGVLIQNGGENWRNLRNGPITRYGGIVLGAMVVAIVLFQLLRGRVRIEGGRSGLTVPRWSGLERTLHWVTAVSFIVLTVTGLSLLYGRSVMIPLIGKDAFAAWAALAKVLHNYSGPVFGVALVLLLLKLLPSNIPNRSDLQWFARGGGLIGHGHPSAGRMNAGEKLWYWLLATFGIALVASGLVLDLLTDLTREQSQTAHLVHAATALVVMAVALGHVYIGTAGTEGSLEGMTTGRVDANWARQHHDQWLEELAAKGVKAEAAPSAPPPTGASKPATAA